MHHLIPSYAQLLMSVVKQPRIRLVGAGLLRGDDPIDMPAELRDIASDDVVIGVGHDAQLEAHGLEPRQRLNHLGKRRHPWNRPGQALTVFGQTRQPQLLQGPLQAEGAQLAKRTVRRGLLQLMFMPVVHRDQAIDVDRVLALVLQDVGGHGFQAFIPLNQRAVAIEGQPFGARGVLECHERFL